MKKIIGLILFVIAIGCVLLINKHHAHTDTTQNDTIKIGIVYPLTGAASTFGDGAKNAIVLFKENMQSMNLKHKYEFILEDSQAQPSIGMSAAMKLINLNHVDAIVDSFSGVGIAVGNITEQAKIPHFSNGQNKEISKGVYNWRLTISENQTGKALYEKLKEKGIHDLIAIRKNAEGPISNYRGFAPFLNHDPKMNVRKIYDYNAGERDFRIMLYKVKKDNPQAILLLAEKPDIDLILKQMKELNINTPIVSIFSLNYVQDKSLAEGAWHSNISLPSRKFIDAYASKFGTETTNLAELVYATLQVIVMIYESSDTKLSGEEVIKRLKMVDGLETPIGPLIYDPQNQILDTSAIIQEIKNGQLVPVESGDK